MLSKHHHPATNAIDRFYGEFQSVEDPRKERKTMRYSMVIALIFILAISAQATTWYVPDDWSTIQDAIDGSANGDKVVVRAGTYVENLDFLGKAITVTSESGPAVTVIDGGCPTNPDFGSVVLFQNGEGLDSVLEGFSITNGSGTLAPSSYYYGGGIYCYYSSPTIINNNISGNALSIGLYSHGGGIYCEHGSPTIAANTVSGNTANGEGGGMFFCLGSSPKIEDNIITNNSANLYGGGIECVFSCSPTIINNVITENTVSQYNGGGILMAYDCSGTIINNTISGNSVGKTGGGFYCEQNCSPILKHNTIKNNSAALNGGGMRLKNSTLLIVQNIISDNSAACGGGAICAYGESSTWINNIISGNDSDIGGAYDGWYCSPIMTNNVFYGNTATIWGGAISCNKSSSMEFANTIFWGNNAPTGPEIWIGDSEEPSVVTINYSDVDGGQASVHVDTGCTLNWGSGMIDADPLFVDAANGDFHLTWNSPCRDTGDNSVVTEALDYEGDPRIALGTVDFGADEYYYHLYHMGDVVPGSLLDLKVVGYPSAPVTLFLGSGVQDPPLSTPFGDFWLNWPPLWQGNGTVPSDGVLVFSSTVPTSWTSGSEHPLQALVGPWSGPWTQLTNLEVIVVE